MRNIKFREWQKEIKEMSYEPYLHEFEDLNTQVNDCDRIFMQYTGLKDKNGIEIYEGDIVKVEGKGLGVGFIEYIESYFRIFRPYVFSVNLCKHTNVDELKSKNNVKIIGNIYENPELLKED